MIFLHPRGMLILAAFRTEVVHELWADLISPSLGPLARRSYQGGFGVVTIEVTCKDKTLGSPREFIQEEGRFWWLVHIYRKNSIRPFPARFCSTLWSLKHLYAFAASHFLNQKR